MTTTSSPHGTHVEGIATVELIAGARETIKEVDTPGGIRVGGIGRRRPIVAGRGTAAPHHAAPRRAARVERRGHARRAGSAGWGGRVDDSLQLLGAPVLADGRDPPVAVPG